MDSSSLLDNNSNEIFTNPNQEHILADEQVRFEKNSPFKTVLEMSFGPLIYQVGIAIHDAVDLFLISKAYTEREIQIVGFASMIRYICMSFAIFFSQACVAKISRLIGESRFKDAGQVVADIYRMSILTMLFIPIAFYFLTKPLLSFMGCTDDMTDSAQEYIIPILIAMPFITTFQLSCGILQSEGRSILCGFMQLTAMILNCGILAPIILFWVKAPFKYAGISFALAQSIPGLILSTLIFNGKFNSCARWRNLHMHPINDSYDALKIASPFILNVIAGTIPPLIMVNFMMKCAAKQGIAANAGSVYSVFLKLQPIVNSFSIGFALGMLSAGSYAHGAKKDGRLTSIFNNTFIITLVLQLVVLPVLVAKADLIASFWISDEESLKLAKKMIRIPFYTNWATAINEVSTALLQCIGHAWTAMSPSLVRGVCYICYALAFYYTNKENCVRMMYVYNANDITILILDIIIIIAPLNKIKISREEYTDAKYI